MILDNSVKIKNFKCFGENLQGFEKIYPLNIIIGKNNSGKSTLTELIKLIVTKDKELFTEFSSNGRCEIIISEKVSKDLVISVFKEGISGGDIPGANHRAYGLNLIGHRFDYKFELDRKKPLENYNEVFLPMFRSREKYVDSFLRLMQTPFQNKVILKINAERDVLPEIPSAFKIPNSNGVNTTNFIREIINNNSYDRNIVEVELLGKLKEIIEPDISFSDIVIEHDDQHYWEIKFKDISGTYIPLSKMGSGIKTILSVLINMIVIPMIQNKKYNNYVFVFEELENNLHPSLLRRLLSFIKEYSRVNSAYFFITTHSTIVLDLFQNNNESQILHLFKTESGTKVETVASRKYERQVIKDLEVKASDILLSNGIVWVEGPSDAIYLDLFITLLNQDEHLFETISYSIQSLSTSIWKYAGFAEGILDFEDDELQNKIISLAKLNHNHLFILDKDSDYEDLPPSKWSEFKNGAGKNKAKLIFESMNFSDYTDNDLESNFGFSINQKLLFWINEGTIETYLQYFINNKGKSDFKKYFWFNKNGYFEKKRSGSNSSISKVELAFNISRHIQEKKLLLSDVVPNNNLLREYIYRLINTIKSWN